MRVRHTHRHQRLAGAAFSNNTDGACCLESLGDAGDGERLRGQRLTQQGRNRRFDGIIRSLHRRYISTMRAPSSCE
jgi:hypothetical protein